MDSKKSQGYFFKIAILTNILIWGLVILNYSSNRPIMDDYDAILKFLCNFKDVDLAEQIKLLFAKHNEHYLLSLKLFSVLSYIFNTHVNFYVVIIFGNLFLLLLYLVFTKSINSYEDRYIRLAIGFLFLNLASGTVGIWPMASFQHFSTLFLVFLTLKIYCELNKPVYEIWPPILLLITVFSGGANLMVIPLIYIHFITTKKFKELKSFTFTVIPIILVLFLSSTKDNSSTYEIVSIWNYLKFIILFLGNPFKSQMGYLFGLICIGFFIRTIQLKFYLSFPQYFYFAFFNILVSIAASYSRISNGVPYALEEKYSIYTLSCWASLIMMFYLDKKSMKKEKFISLFNKIVLLFSFIVCITTYENNFSRIKELSNIDWVIHPQKNQALEILSKSEELKIYEAKKYMNLDK